MPWYISTVQAFRRSGRSITTRSTPFSWVARRPFEPRSIVAMRFCYPPGRPTRQRRRTMLSPFDILPFAVHAVRMRAFLVALAVIAATQAWAEPDDPAFDPSELPQATAPAGAEFDAEPPAPDVATGTPPA